MNFLRDPCEADGRRVQRTIMVNPCAANAWGLILCIAFAGCGDLPVESDAAGPDAAGPDAVGLPDAMSWPDGGGYDDAARSPDVDEADGGGVDAFLVDATTPDVASPPDVPEPPVPRSEVEMTYMTANIGRAYSRRARVVEVIDGLADFMDSREPAFIGWQEIGGADPCGECEIEVIRARLVDPWDTRRPVGTSERRGMEQVHTPISDLRGGSASARAIFASPQWDGQSSTRFVTVVHFSTRNLSVINTHLIAGAWTCQPDQAQRRDYWQRGWSTLQEAVRTEHSRGRNVVVTGDLNRGGRVTSCNPAWNPGSLHAAARRIGGGETIDYIFAVPANRWRFRVARNMAGEPKRGSRTIGLDGHRAHWVAGSFLPE